jgi:hypothetical protein
MLIQPASACLSIRACTTKAISEAAPMLAIASRSSVASRREMIEKLVKMLSQRRVSRG